GVGSVLVLDDEVHAARWVRKQESLRVSAFVSPGRGPIGRVTPAGARVLLVPSDGVHVAPPAALNRTVAVLQTYTGMEEGVVDAVLDVSGAGGLVLEGTGTGNVPGSAVAGVERALSRGVAVVIATRTLTGGTAPT